MLFCNAFSYKELRSIMAGSKRCFLRLVTDSDVEAARDLMSQEERIVLLALLAGAQPGPVEIGKKFGISRHKASRLLERVKRCQHEILGQKAPRTRA